MDIVQAIRAQMLGQLIDAVGTATAAKGGAAQALPQSLTTGQTLSATVLGELPGGRIALRVAGQQVVADTRGSPLPRQARLPGAVLRLAVEAAGATPRLTLAGIEPQQQGVARLPAPEIQANTPLVRLAATPPETSATARPATPQSTPLQSALKEAITAAAAKQGGAAPLYATLASLTARPDIPIPEPVRQIAQSLLGGRIDAERAVAPDSVKLAMAMAAGSQPDTANFRTLLATLKMLLPKPADTAPASRADPQPEPPRRDAAPAAQKPALPALAADADSKTITATLHREAEQALERAKLQSYAGLPEQRIGQSETARPQQLQVEIPLAFGPQTAMMGLKIERDRRRRKEDGTPIDVWGIRFAIETDEIGAVHAHLKLAGPTLNVSLWADDAATHGAFVQALPLLEAALRDAALEVGEVHVFNGRPQEPPKPAVGHFLDMAS